MHPNMVCWDSLDDRQGPSTVTVGGKPPIGSGSWFPAFARNSRYSTGPNARISSLVNIDQIWQTRLVPAARLPKDATLYMLLSTRAEASRGAEPILTWQTMQVTLRMSLQAGCCGGGPEDSRSRRQPHTLANATVDSRLKALRVKS